MLGSKANALCLLEILKKHSDDTHILTMEDLQNRMRSEYGIELERKAVYANLNLLSDFGYDISMYADNKKGYCLCSREFEPSEVHLLADAVYSSSFIPEKATLDLIKKLQATQSKHFSSRIKSMTFIRPDVKTANKELFYNIEILDDAVSQGVKVTFDYLRYDINKRLVARRDTKYIVSPYAVVWANEKYYLICYYEKYNSISHFRIDKIKNITLLEEKAVPAENGFSPYNYAKSAIYMYGNKAERIEIVCDMDILDDVIDRFGKDIHIESCGKNQFKAVIYAALGGIKFWALQYLQHCEITYPQSLRAEVAQIIKAGMDKYY